MPHIFKTWQPEASTNRSKQKTSYGKIIVLFLSPSLLFFPRTVPYRRIRYFPQIQRKLCPRCHCWNLRGRFPPFGFESAELREEPRQLSRFAFNPWSAPCGCACPSHMPCHFQSGRIIIGAYALRPKSMAMNCHDMGSWRIRCCFF